MLLYVQARINERTGWADWFINLFLVFMAVLAILTVAVAATEPSGLLTVLLWAAGGSAVAAVISFGVALERLGEFKSNRRTRQQELIAPAKFPFIDQFKLGIRSLAPGIVFAATVCGFMAVLLE